MTEPLRFSGVMPANVLPFTSDLAIDEPAYRRHLRWLETEWDVAAWSESTIEHAIRGSAHECVEQLRAHVESGVDRLVLIPYRYEPEQVELIARDVLPRLARATMAPR